MKKGKYPLLVGEKSPEKTGKILLFMFELSHNFVIAILNYIKPDSSFRKCVVNSMHL